MCIIMGLNSHLKQVLIGFLCSNPDDYLQMNLHMWPVKVADSNIKMHQKLHLLPKQYTKI